MKDSVISTYIVILLKQQVEQQNVTPYRPLYVNARPGEVKDHCDPAVQHDRTDKKISLVDVALDSVT